MRRRSPEFNFWPGVADTMLIAFIILLGLWFGQQALSKLETATGTGGIRVDGEEWRKLNEEVAKLREELRAKTEELAMTKARIAELEKRNVDLEKHAADMERRWKQAEAALNDKPPMIALRDSEGFRFPSGTAEITGDFSSRLERDIFPQIETAIEKYRPNTIEIIGHTDGQGVKYPGKGNLDKLLGEVVSGSKAAEALHFGSNADLGLIRAAVVRRIIERWLEQKGLAGAIQVRCYSAANTVPFSDRLNDPAVFAGEDAARRRIEIRFTQLPTKN